MLTQMAAKWQPNGSQIVAGPHEHRATVLQGSANANPNANPKMEGRWRAEGEGEGLWLRRVWAAQVLTQPIQANPSANPNG